jgi:hypothetical protein
MAPADGISHGVGRWYIYIYIYIQLPSAFPPPCPNLSEAPEPQVRWVSKS